MIVSTITIYFERNLTVLSGDELTIDKEANEAIVSRDGLVVDKCRCMTGIQGEEREDR